MEQFYQLLALIGVGLYWILVAGVTLRVVLRRRAVSVSLAWLMIIYIIPVLGVFCYFLFGELNLGRKRAQRAHEMFSHYEDWFNQLHDCQAHLPDLMSPQITKIDELCTNRMGIPALCGNNLSLRSSPSNILRSIIEDIESAQSHIRMVFYIWNHGGLVDAVGSALIRAAKRGVDVKILLDSAGSHRFFRSHWVDMMTKSGIKIEQALAVSPWRVFLRRLDLRQHRKIIVIDEQVAYTGSMNMVDPAFFKQNAGVGEWIDVMVRITGPTVNVLSAIHAWDWEVETGERILPQLPHCVVPQTENPLPVQVVPSGPGMPDNLIQQVLTLTINQAQESVRITTPYFVPSEELLEELKMTAQRGVKVDIILPKKNDSVMVQWASRAFYEELLQCGVRIYEFEGGLLHTKSVVVDGIYCLVGTVNLDMRSLWLNFELTLAIDNVTFTKQMSELQQSYADLSVPVSLEEWRQRKMYYRFLERIFFLFSPLL
ncbi:cardiolipin synthase [Vibrio sp. 99-8-1]|uniref:cardiolipin synthase n=1 Tax=Vibrio sp. 99-8-1 TaxID=2607602 RepID=UPI001493AAE5|nr:cardiolipin synthase [Vibrio sp. 99-8-1]NOI67837.1 cardiolipin synthase [Vibrio sp. 99-8-1]